MSRTACISTAQKLAPSLSAQSLELRRMAFPCSGPTVAMTDSADPRWDCPLLGSVGPGAAQKPPKTPQTRFAAVGWRLAWRQCDQWKSAREKKTAARRHRLNESPAR